MWEHFKRADSPYPRPYQCICGRSRGYWPQRYHKAKMRIFQRITCWFFLLFSTLSQRVCSNTCISFTNCVDPQNWCLHFRYRLTHNLFMVSMLQNIQTLDKITILPKRKMACSWDLKFSIVALKNLKNGLATTIHTELIYVSIENNI